MVGGGNKRVDGISSTNIFAALESRRRKSSKKDKKDSVSKPLQQKPAQFWAPAPVTVKSWADVDDDDDYFATSSPPPPVWGSDQVVDSVSQGVNETLSQAEESEGEDDVFDEADDDAEEEQEQHEAGPAVASEKVVKRPFVSPVVISKEPERQLSKKELKKKELAELDAVLEELGLAPKETKEHNGSPTEEKLEMAIEEANEDAENKNGGPALSESKSSKRRKAKKEKSFKELRDGEDQVKDVESQAKDGESDQPADVDSSRKEEEHAEAEANAVALDPKERLKKLASFKKKKSSKEVDAAAKAAAAEAAARAAKLATAKKKEKNHYNQQPVR